MATKSDERIEQFRSEFLPKLVGRFRPTLVLVFGSRARKEALKHSDLDLVIVSDAFRDIRWLDRSVRVIEELDASMGMDVLCYTPEEYAQKRQELGIVRTASEEGIVLLGNRNF